MADGYQCTIDKIRLPNPTGDPMWLILVLGVALIAAVTFIAFVWLTRSHA